MRTRAEHEQLEAQLEAQRREEQMAEELASLREEMQKSAEKERVEKEQLKAAKDNLEAEKRTIQSVIKEHLIKISGKDTREWQSCRSNGTKIRESRRSNVAHADQAKEAGCCRRDEYQYDGGRSHS